MSVTSCIIILLLCLATLVNCARILCVFMIPSYSHQIFYQPIWKELSLRGHQVTVYTSMPLNDKSLINLTEYDLGFSLEIYKKMNNWGNSGGDNSDVLNVFYHTAEAQLNHKYMKDLIANVRNETYDLLLVEYIYPTYFTLKDVFKVPMIGVTSMQLGVLAADRLGMEKHPVVQPEISLPFAFAKTFKQRLHSWWFNWIYRIYFKTVLAPKFDQQIKRHFGPDRRGGYEYGLEVSLVIGNSNFAIHNVVPKVPAYVPVHGLHLKPVQPLPKDLANFLDTSINDIIYFSLGTNVRISVISNNVISVILKVLSRLPYTILWKCDPDYAKSLDLPKNVHIRKWFPQQDLLGDRRVKLFINQGGIQSIDEAISRKVPMLIIPFIGDQKLNADRCYNLGIAEWINYRDFTENEFETKILNLLTKPSYRKNIETQHRIANDYPMNGLDTAIFWIEYVIRHKGASHLRYPLVDLPFYQYYLLDIYCFVFLLIFVIVYVLKRVFALIFCRKVKQKEKKL